ncbi:MAG: DegT/DnrJ/EryC1/StrS family aminotransferase [Candidatus Rokubacteria bacterium]|nr:DegT/DnrJ/EryC1/StrS family aminotransferase [Candidatus Rokubacteria bacterium]MBI3827547.1 DegT/DnrJ/EryC1/StrS family aminotransferase [Candidatus Rokubacteria bacterium]
MIPFIDLTRQHAGLRAELVAATARVLDSARFVLGPEGEALEAELAALAGVRHGIGVGSGTDALRLALTAVGVGPGDEVLTPAFSFVASASTILMAGAVPVFVDVDPATFALDPDAAERAISARTRAVVAVHLYGHPAPMDAVGALARRHGLAVIEDAAQAVGASYAGRPVGAWSDATCLSFYPTKNLGAAGDAGMVLTDRDDVAARVRRLRHHGDGGRYRHVELGLCSRLDEMQAAVLRVKLRRLAAWTDEHRRIAACYDEGLAGLLLVRPVERPPARHVYHLYTVRHPDRDHLAKQLADLGVGTAVHYPLPVPGQPLFGGGGEGRWPEAWRASREVLSLPCFAGMRDEEIHAVVRAVRLACGGA